MPGDLFNYKALVVRVVDGDTVILRVDLGFRLSAVYRFRLAGINAPELKTPEGKAAKEFIAGLIDQQPVYIETAKDPLDKYGRWLATIWLDPSQTSINQQMVETGHAVIYD